MSELIGRLSSAAAGKLLDAGADVNARDNNGKTALMYTAIYSHTGMTRLLIDAGADVSARDNNGENAAEFALYKPNSDRESYVVKFIELLIRNGAQLKFKQTDGKNNRIVSAFAKAGLDANAFDADGNIVLDRAAAKARFKAARAFLAAEVRALAIHDFKYCKLNKKSENRMRQFGLNV